MSQDSQSFVQRLPLMSDKPLVGYAIALLLAFGAWLLRYEIGDALPPGFPYLTFFPAVIFTAFFFGTRPGIIAALVSGLLAWYSFIAPVNSFALSFNSALALLFYSFIVTVDIALIHWMVSANHRLDIERQRSVELKEQTDLLFNELQHRVGNNLQMVSSLIGLQRSRLTDETARAALDQASQRLGLIGRIQRRLYSSTGEQLSLATYIDQICREVMAASGGSGIEYEFDPHADTTLAPDQAIPTALVVAEALSNSLEHGFGSGDSGKVTVTLCPDNGGVEVLIADNGKGLPDNFDLEASDSLGLSLVNAFARTLGGTFTLEPVKNGQGTVARLWIKAGEGVIATNSTC